MSDIAKQSPGYGACQEPPNHDKPLTFAGIEFAKRFIGIRGSSVVGCCIECYTAVKVALVAALADVRAQIPEAITDYKPRWARWDLYECTQCGWQGHEGQMRELPAIISGKYRGGCPACDAKNQFLGPTLLKSREGFTVEPTL